MPIKLAQRQRATAPKPKKVAAPVPREDIPLFLGDVDTQFRRVSRIQTLPVIRQSTVTAFEDCPRKGMFQWAYGMRGYYRASALDRGSYAHAVCQALIAGEDMAAVEVLVSGMYHAVIASVAMAPAYQGDPRNVPDKIKDDSTKDMNIGLAAGIQAYKALRPLIDKGVWTPVAIEASIVGEMKLGDITFQVRGRIDTCFKGRDGTVCAWDLKSTDNDLGEYLETAHLHIQPYLYVHAMRQGLVDGVDPASVGGFLFQPVKKLGIRQKGNETLTEYIARVNSTYDDMERAGEPTSLLHKVPVPAVPSKSLVERVARCLDYMNRPLVLDNFPPFERSCGRCLYKKLCKDSTGRSWKDTVTQSFTQARDPLDSDPNRNATVALSLNT